jgi:RHS repeat-associated protein
VADAQGPLTGATITRRAFLDGPLTENDTNDFGNVTRYTYDGLDRRIRTEIVLTASGTGDGVHVGASLEGVKNDLAAPESFLPTPDPAQGGGDGIIRIATVYDANSLVTSRIDDNGNVTLYLYDNLDRRVTETKGLTVDSGPLTKALILGSRQIVTPTAATINDPATIPATLINAQLAAAEARMDAVEPLFPPLADQIDDSPPTTIVYGFDPDDNLLIFEDENDSEMFYLYDAVNRGVAVRMFRAGQTDSHVGDPLFAPDPASDPSNPSTFPAIVGTTKQDFEYDGLSRRVRATDNNDPAAGSDDVVITLAFDSLGRVIEETRQMGALSAKAISSAWRAEDLRVGLTYPNDRALKYTFDQLDRLETITDVGEPDSIVEYDYIGTYRVLKRSFLNGTRMTYLDAAGGVEIGYDGLRRAVELQHLRSDVSLIVGFTHTYDRMNNKLGEGKLHDPANDEVYTYDSAYRLIDFDRPNPGAITPLHGDWTLDGAGNWQAVDGETREHSSLNEITQRTDGGTTTLVYDDNGNLTDDGTYEFAWDASNRLSTVTRKSDGALVATYSYDPHGQRVRKVVTNSGSLDGTTDFYYNGWQVIEERDVTDVLTQQYVYGNDIDEVLVMDRNLDGDGTATGPGDDRLYYHQNTLNSTYALTDVSEDVVEGYLYDAYGHVTVYEPGGNGVVDFGGDDNITVGGHSAVANPYLFTGRRLDAETSLYYYRLRYFDTQLGRFISRDQIGVWGDPTNLGSGYAYVANGPVNFVDPYGYGNNNGPYGNSMSNMMDAGIAAKPPDLPDYPDVLRGCTYAWCAADQLSPVDVQPQMPGDEAEFVSEAADAESIIRAWKDPDYRASLSAEQLSSFGQPGGALGGADMLPRNTVCCMGVWGRLFVWGRLLTPDRQDQLSRLGPGPYAAGYGSDRDKVVETKQGKGNTTYYCSCCCDLKGFTCGHGSRDKDTVCDCCKILRRPYIRNLTLMEDAG